MGGGDQGDDGGVTPRQGMWKVLLLGTLVLFAARFVLSLIRTGPIVVADEMGYLGNARAIVGHIGAQMELAPFYRGGYSLLIAPLVAIGGSPTFTYHLVLVLNALLVACVFPLLYLLLTRFGAVSPKVAIWAAFAAAVYPALTVLSQAALSENALFPLVCVWLLAFGGLLSADRRRGTVWAVALGGATGALWAVHNRMIVAVALAVVGMVWLAYRRRIGPGALALGLFVIGLAFLGTHYLDGFVVDHNYGGQASDELSSRMGELSGFSGLRTAAANLLGQTWYLLVATFGLSAAAAVSFFRTRPRVPVLGVLLTLTVLLLLISAAAFPERTRPDMLIYGRYAEIAAPPLVAFGLAALAGARLRRRLTLPLVGFATLTGAVVLIRATASDPGPVNRWNISSLPFLTFELGPGVLIAAALVAVAGGWLLLRASASGRRTLGAVAIALLLAVTAYGAWNPVHSEQQSVYSSAWTSPQGPAEAVDGGTVSYDLDHYDTTGLYAFQWFLPNEAFVLFHGSREKPPTNIVLSGDEYGHERAAGNAEEIWSAPGRDQALWRLAERHAPPGVP
jgi:hypothetical protein